MTRKDYIQLAEELAIDRRDIERLGLPQHGMELTIALTAFDLAVSTIMDALRRDNSRFDREKFTAAVVDGSEESFTRGVFSREVWG
jgi:hypothetical protein